MPEEAFESFCKTKDVVEIAYWLNEMNREVEEFQESFCGRSKQKEKKMNEDLDFGAALNHLWDGKLLARPGWNGKDMYIKMQFPDKQNKMTKPYIYMHTADRELVPWLASQTDLLASDWSITGPQTNNDPNDPTNS